MLDGPCKSQPRTKVKFKVSVDLTPITPRLHIQHFNKLELNSSKLRSAARFLGCDTKCVLCIHTDIIDLSGVAWGSPRSTVLYIPLSLVCDHGAITDRYGWITKRIGATPGLLH